MRTKRVAMLMLLMAPLALVIAILLDGLTDNVAKSDVGIVLGSKVMPDGTPSARLRARLDKADELFQLGMFKSVIVSGGTGKEGRSEARVMADYLALCSNNLASGSSLLFTNMVRSMLRRRPAD
jgi:vancomycin permeability regulator SanA